MFEHSWKNDNDYVCSKCEKYIEENINHYIYDKDINFCTPCFCELIKQTEDLIYSFIGQKYSIGIITNDDCIPRILKLGVDI